MALSAQSLARRSRRFNNSRCLVREETEQRQRQMGLVFARIEKLARVLGIRWDEECRRVSDVTADSARSAVKRTGRRRTAAQRATA
jgi:hypothetical protein